MVPELWELIYPTVSFRSAEVRYGALLAPGRLGAANQRAQFHHRLVVVAGLSFRDKLLRQQPEAAMGLSLFGVPGKFENPAQNALDVSVQQRLGLIEGNAQYRPCSVGPNAW